MQVPEEPGFYVPTPRKDGNEYAHIGSLDGSDQDYTKIPATQSKRYGSYIVRAPPSSRQMSTHFNVNCASRMRYPSETRPLKPRREHKHLELLDPLVEESLQRSISQQNRLSSVVTPTKAKSRRSSVTPPSEHRQRRRNLSRFTKELERYCVAASTNGRAPLPPSTPTVSESPTTLHTVTELLPYHKQFKFAGLAVTSHEQIPRIPDSAQPQLPARHAGRLRGTNVAAVQIDGSTVDTSDQTPVDQASEAPAVPDKEEAGSSDLQPTFQASQPQTKPGSKSFLPWSLKQNPSLASTAHSSRKFSKGHMHPSPATPAEPVLTPLGLIDSYFDSPQPLKPQDGQSTERNSSSSAVSSTIGSHSEKPLPEQPPTTRRPIPPRSERRHLENTAEWPTAGVLIHDNPTPLPQRAESVGVLINEPAPANNPRSVHSWTTVEDDLPDKPERSPPVPPKEATASKSTDTVPDVEEKPEIPPKDDLPKGTEAPQGRGRHQGHSLYNKWMKATCLRRRASARVLIMPTTIREESGTLAEGSKKPQQAIARSKDAPPRIPSDLISPVEDSSSFERALDAVISKLDAMEERRRYERKMDLEAARQALNKSDSSDRATSRPVSPKPRALSEQPTSDVALETVPSPEVAIVQSDKDINDRDILLGLKMAICAACDENLDAWICSKTGLRLRRFLADLKAFDLVSQDRKASELLPMSRQIRRNDEENRRLQAEQQRRKRNSKPWPPCFGGDGQGSFIKPGDVAGRDLVAE